MTATVTHLVPAAPHPAELAELERRLADLAAVSEDSYRYVLGQALDSAAALLEAHARRAVS